MKPNPFIRTGAVACALAAGAAGLVASAPRAAADGPPADGLPDLVQAPPSGLDVQAHGESRGTGWALGFRSAVENHGAGPLLIRAHRADRSTRSMTADQVVHGPGGATSVRRAIGRLRFVRSSDHEHWHYVGFDRYTLRPLDGSAAPRRDRKTGFCLGDRYDADPLTREPFEPPAPVQTGACGIFEPDRRRVREGISVGYGDDYAAHLEGQSIELTGLRGGRYVLTHRVNADGRIREQRRDNDAASLLVRLRWPNGHGSAPRVTTLRECPGRPSCAPVPAG